MEHFFGTLVIKPEKDGFANRSVVVDGQQRLTTTLILLIALRDLETDDLNKEHITNTYLINNTSTFQDKIKLKQVTKDWESYRALINGDISSARGVIRNAYIQFSKLIRASRINNPSITLHHYITAIERMNVAVIFLDERAYKGEDPQIIFETLNSLGRPLSLSDLVRNYVLLNMNSKNQSNIYENIWHPKVELILGDNTSYFLRDYLQLKLSSDVKAVSDNNTKEIYRIFKRYVEDTFDSHSDFIANIAPYAKWYNWIIQTENNDTISLVPENDKTIKELIRNIFHDIKADAFKSFVLGLLLYHQNSSENDTLSDHKLIQLLQAIRTYLIRRRVFGLTQGENIEIPILCKKIPLLVDGSADLIDLFSNLTYRLRLPSDAEIQEQFSNMNFYELKKYSKFILGKIEETVSKVPIDFRNSKITIEHIMPQTLNATWVKELGDNYKEVHEKFLHNIGNLILTEFNAEMGNKSFSEKQKHLETSNLNFRCFVIEQDVWNSSTITQHYNIMYQRFIKTFPIPAERQFSANWNTREIESNNISPLDPDVSDVVDGRKPDELRIEGKTIKVKSWRDILTSFLKYINSNYYDLNLIFEKQSEFKYKNDMIVEWSTLSQMIEDNFDLSKRYKSLDGKFWDKTDNIYNSTVFVHIYMTASECMKRVANIMNIYNMPEDSVEIILKSR